MSCLRKAFQKFDGLEVSYEDITMGKDLETIRNDISDMILGHLGVKLRTLYTNLKKGASRYDEDGR